MQKSSNLENLNWRPDPPDDLGTKGFDFNELLGRAVSLFRNKNRSHVGYLLQAIGKMHIRSSGIIGLVYSVFYCLNDNFACVNPYANLQIWITETGHPVLHCKSGQAAAYGVILMWLGSAKYCHYPVALGLVDDALVSSDGFSHYVQDGLEAPHPGFGIA
jgi:hypothetical protein